MEKENQKLEQANLEGLSACINDLLLQIDRANKAMKRHQSSELLVEQYQDQKKRYSAELIELLKEFDLEIQINQEAEKWLIELLSKIRPVYKIIFLFCFNGLVFLFNTWVLLQLWDWFISTTFHLTNITFIQALGISIIIGFLRYKPDTYKEFDNELLRSFRDAYLNLVSGIISLGFGYLYSLFL